MKVYVRKWTREGNYEVVATLPLGMFEGVSFRQMEEKPATAVNLKGLRVTEIYTHASETNALCVYVEEVRDGKV